MARKESEETKIQNKRTFINATKKLMQTLPIAEISIRKIADESGFHNSTIYLYFPDIDRLIALSSVKYFEEYARRLVALDNKKPNPIDRFFGVWEIFCDISFENPKTFLTLFFGKYGENMTDILNEYYDLYPEEKLSLTDETKLMYYGKNVIERCHHLMMPMLNESSTRLTKENYDLANDIIVSCLHTALDMVANNKEIDPSVIKNHFLDAIRHTIF